MTVTQHLRKQVRDQVMTLTLQRADRKNALTQQMYRDLAAALREAEADPQVRVVLLCADGADFTAGNDLGDFAAVANGTLAPEDLQSQVFLEALATFGKPAVVAVQGRAVGIGVTMLLHFDLVFVAEDARLSTPFVNLGVVPEAGSSMLLPARIGYTRAFAMFALGDALDGLAAARLGIATLAVPGTELLVTAQRAADALATRAPAALRATKALMRDPELLLSTLRREAQVFGERLRAPEAAEALQAFESKRPADFGRFR